MPVPRKRIAFSQLVEWVEGRLPEKEARAVEEQVAVADAATLADVAWLRKFVSATEASVLESPPPEVRSTLIARFRAPAEGRRTPGLLKRVVATLTFDGGLRPAVGVRSAGTQGARRQLVYSVDDLDVALNFLPRARDKNFDLDGQVLPRDDVELGSFSVQLLQSETELGITATDDLGAFAFESIPSGVYEIILSTERVEVSIAPVELNV
ncbi:MAG TPA: hypothetical protein VE525_07515 [Rubrobacter sp.]|nr:hypothetical protein [Rubrobacter sp.]